MRTRMDKYHNNEELLERTSKNDSLYEQLYREKQTLSSNVTVLDNIDEIDISKYNEVLYCYNDFWDNESEVMKNKKYEVIISKGTKVRCIYAEGWWHVIFESEDGKEAYVVYYTPAGVT